MTAVTPKEDQLTPLTVWYALDAGEATARLEVDPQQGSPATRRRRGSNSTARTSSPR